MGQKTTAKNQMQKLSAQSSSFLLGLGLPAALTLSGFICQTGALSGFGWALLAALAGCLATTVLGWSTLLRTLVPERVTWKKSIIAGLLLAAALVLQGIAVGSSGWNPIHALGLAFIPWSRTMWRLVVGKEVLAHWRSRISALLLTLAAIAYLWPELIQIYVTTDDTFAQLQVFPDASQFAFSLPRSLSFLSAVCFGAASSLQVAQERSISSLTFWSIPTAISSIVLGLVGWVALQQSGERAVVMGNFDLLPLHRLFVVMPAFIFGVMMLTLRPRTHIKNSLLIGREPNSWWQSLGLGAGCALTLTFWNNIELSNTDVLMCFLVLAGQFIGLRLNNNPVRFMPTLSVVTDSGNLQDTRLLQNS